MRQHTCCIRVLTVAVAVALELAASRAGSVAAGHETMVDGVVHVRNAAQPAAGIESLRLEERWRVGGADEEFLFGQVIRAITDPDGNVYLLDAQLN